VNYAGSGPLQGHTSPRSARGLHGDDIRDLLGVAAAGGTAMWRAFVWGVRRLAGSYSRHPGAEYPMARQCEELLLGGGAAHSQCNLEYRDTKTIPVVFHNLPGYYGHLLMEELAKSGKLRVIPNNTERGALYIGEQQIDVGLLKGKGVFPYGYVDHLRKVDEQHLSPIEAFHNDLINTDICEEDYEQAQKVWRDFQCRNLGEYSDLHMKTNVLAEIFENFRQNCVKNYDLDAAQYYIAPGLSWDAMLKYTGVELDTLQDVNMVIYVERGIRDGMTQCSTRHVRANNKYMPYYNPSLPST
ncbi:hypothetical protein Trydic_g14226, partial [Trypoxylus dichotomus]